MKKSNIYTKTGDDGTTGLVGGSRVKKYNSRLEAYGTVDELNSSLGMLSALDIPEDISETITVIQNKLFNIGSRLASDSKGNEFTAQLSIQSRDIEFLENKIDTYESDLEPLSRFVLPGGNQVVAQCHVARTICRRAERRIVAFAENEKIDEFIIKYINRLSDFLFVLARKLAFESGVNETFWEP